MATWIKAELRHAVYACIVSASSVKSRLVTKVKMQQIVFWIEIFIFKNWKRMRQKVEMACFNESLNEKKMVSSSLTLDVN